MDKQKIIKTKQEKKNKALDLRKRYWGAKQGRALEEMDASEGSLF